VELGKSPELRGLENPAVIALPRGAVVVAIEVAEALDAPLTVMPVEELSTPGKPEYVVGAVAENAIHVIDSDALAALGVSEDSLAVRVAEATALIAKLLQLYRPEEFCPSSLSERPVIVVDDGSTTIPALEAVAVALARHKVDTLWLATPLPPEGAPQGYERIVTTPRSPEQADGMAVLGLWYDDHTAPSDEVAAAMLREFASSRAH
jgi:predicted phosphoribosyltransferase